MLCSITLQAQTKLHINITDRNTHKAIPLVTIIADSTNISTADTNGYAMLLLTAGTHRLQLSMTGYKRLDTAFILSGDLTLNAGMEPDESELEEVTIVASTRNNERIESSPVKVEVLGKEEVSEEAGIKPGNIASLLGDVSGVQIQQLSASSGNSNVRIQGLDGRYTQILRDGMPLYDGFSGGFGILTIPPLDLKQIELIKGSASTLYGGGAIGGLVNLISKTPGYGQSLDALVNYTTLNEFNANVYTAKRNKKLGYTLFAGFTTQKATDVNSDSYSDVPKTRSFIVHPTLFFYLSPSTTLSVGYSGILDKRKGGEMNAIASSTVYRYDYLDENNSQRHTGTYHLDHSFQSNMKLTVKGTVSYFDQATTTNIYTLRGNQISYYHEGSLFVPTKNGNIVAGINITGNGYKTEHTPQAHLQSYDNLTFGTFVQYTLHIKEKTTIEAGLRLDAPQYYEPYTLPRLAVLHKLNSHWACRAGFGMGYKLPDPLLPQIIEFDPLLLLHPDPSVRPELSYGFNAEINYKKEWDNGLSFFINEALFFTDIERPILFQQDTHGVAPTGYIYLINANSPVKTQGSDTYVKLSLKSWELYMGYTYTDARNTYLPAGQDFVPLTPRNRIAAVLTKEIKKLWRFGVEASYTGHQYRYDNTTTPDYTLIALMAQRNIGKHISIVLNCENALDYRMTKYERVYTGWPSTPVAAPLWAPIDGRVINLSVRWKM